MFHRTLSLLLFFGYVVFAIIFLSGKMAFLFFIVMFSPVICIWFPEEMGLYYPVRSITSVSPPWLLRAVCWFVLILPVFIWLYLKWSN